MSDHANADAAEATAAAAAENDEDDANATTDAAAAAAEKEKRRKKQLKKMAKLVAKCWALPDAEPFQEDDTVPSDSASAASVVAVVLDLTRLGQKIDAGHYKLGKQGWERFARDLGGVYNRHVARKTKQAAKAKEHLKAVTEWLGHKDPSLAKLAAEHIPKEPEPQPNNNNNNTTTPHSSSHKKRKAGASAVTSSNKTDATSFASPQQQQQLSSSSLAATTTATTTASSKKFKLNSNAELAEREEHAVAQLQAFVQERGGDPAAVADFRARVTKKRATTTSTSATTTTTQQGGNNHVNNNSNNSKQHNKYDVIFLDSATGRRFRSMLEVGRFLKLVHDGGRGSTENNNNNSNRSKRALGFHKSSSFVLSSREQEAEKKRLRKELEKLRKAHQRAVKSLDDFAAEEKESRYPMNDRLLMEEQLQQQQQQQNGTKATTGVTSPTCCAAALVCDIEGFPGIPEHCIPDLLMAWDFLCTFQRPLNLTPIALDDFAAAVAYVPPPEGQVLGDDVLAPPVNLAEAHLGLLKLLLQDRSSDDWWWSTLESDEMMEGNGGTTAGVGDADGRAGAGGGAQYDDSAERALEGKPVIRINVTAMLSEEEDPLITCSWIKALEDCVEIPVTAPPGKNKNHTNIGSNSNNSRKKMEDVKRAIRTAMKIVSNKWIMAYLRKTLQQRTGGGSSSGYQFVRYTILWLVRTMKEARPDLYGSVSKAEVSKRRAKVIEESTKAMDALPVSSPVVTEDDANMASTDMDEEDEESDSDDEDADGPEKEDTRDESKKPASTIPPKPLPSLVDLLLPPAKPHFNAEFVNAFTWYHLVGAAAMRVLHRKKRTLNEIDDSLRTFHELPPLTITQRREREALVASRILTECAETTIMTTEDGVQQRQCIVEKAIDHLCTGGNYLELSVPERLCMLRLLIEAAYDSWKVYEVVDGNYKQRTSAMKSLELEQRKAKKDAKEKAAADEVAAREKLAVQAREKFLDEKREEILKQNEKSQQFTEEFMESITDEDILEFDEDIKADYDALPGPDSFNKSEVNAMIVRMKEEAAFETDALRVLTMDEVLEQDQRHIEEMEGQLLGFGGTDALVDDSLDRETLRSIERLQRDLDKAKSQAERLPELRAKAIEHLRDAIQDGTIKVLRTALIAAKKAKLCGPDDETGGMWALDIMRDAALELENAKQNKKLIDAQKDLVSKRNKCFIRSEPLGRDRFGNRFWSFETDEAGHVWVETEYVLTTGDTESSTGTPPPPPPGYLDLRKDIQSVSTGAKDMEEDLVSDDDADTVQEFRQFSRREYHSAALAPTLLKHHWGCQATEESLRTVIKSLDSRGIRENELKTSLKEALEEIAGTGEKQEPEKEERSPVEDEDKALEHVEAEGDESAVHLTDDETVFQAAIESYRENQENSADLPDLPSSAIGKSVRVRRIIDESKETGKEPAIARYETGTVTGWKMRAETVEVSSTEDDDEMDEDDGNEAPQRKTKNVQYSVWRVATDRGHTYWLTGAELIQCLIRFEKYTSKRGYFENDSAFFSYRNSLGRYCGKASDAPYASSPIYFARLMVKKEAELYTKLKARCFDNNWGGKSGARALWTNSMKDYAFDFQTAKQGLLTLENAFFELTGEFSEYENADESPDANELLLDPASRYEIELETIEKSIPGLWNSPASRAIFIYIVSDCKTTGFLALALDLLCRNTSKFLQTHKVKARNTRSEVSSLSYDAPTTRTTRRMNAWQQANKDW